MDCMANGRARVLIPHGYLRPGKGKLHASGFKSGVVGGHLTDLKIWRTARSGMSQLQDFSWKHMEKSFHTMSCKAILKFPAL
jgi:hypothetical protein